MHSLFQTIVVAVCLALTGCVSAVRSIEIERKAYLADPTIPRYGFDGKLTKGGAHYLYLLDHDPEFGDFLLAQIPQTNDVRVVLAALTYFASKHPDLSQFDRAVASIKPELLNQEVDLSDSDAIQMVPLREWIKDARQKTNHAPQPTTRSVTPTTRADDLEAVRFGLNVFTMLYRAELEKAAPTLYSKVAQPAASYTIRSGER